ncbi:hypothetical protein MTO96_048770 [Rhipicephalus appendiculatus]
MIALLTLTVVCSAMAALSGQQPRKVDCDQRQADTKSVYDFHISELSGERIMNLSQYRGHVLLLVNVATYCRLTYTYKELNAVQEKFGSHELYGDWVSLQPVRQARARQKSGDSERHPLRAARQQLHA